MKTIRTLNPTNDARCGTPQGDMAHYRRKELSCKPCWEAKKLQKAKYYQDNIEKIKIRQSQYRVDNAEKEKRRQQEYYLLNIHKFKIKAAKYLAEHPEIYRKSSSRRRAKIHDNGFEEYSESQILELYGIDCHICQKPIDLSAPRRIGKQGWQQALHIDHLIPISKGGADSLANVRPSHGLCNLKKATN